MEEKKVINERSAKHARNMKLKTLNEVAKSICKIKKKDIKSTGFFLKFEYNEKILYYLVTAWHNIKKAFLEQFIEIISENGIKKEIKLNEHERQILFLSEYDITAVEIIDKDNLKDKVKFLNYDLNCKKENYNCYLYADSFTMQHPNGNELECSSGKIVEVESPRDFAFQHTLDTNKGSSGSPILLFEKLNEEPKVIGVHTSAVCENKNNVGSFIDVLINKLKDINQNKRKKKNLKDIKDIKSIKDTNIFVNGSEQVLNSLGEDKNLTLIVSGTITIGGKRKK